jgi:hypothetical protein
MTKKLDEEIARSARFDARGLEAEADSVDPYPEGTSIVRPNRPSRMFNLRLTDEQFGELQELARKRHLPVSTMARSWLLERLDRERQAS